MAAPSPAPVAAAPTATKTPSPAGVELCRTGILVTIVGWTKDVTDHRTQTLLGADLHEGTLDLAVLGDETVSTPRASQAVDETLATLPVTLPELPVDAAATLQQVETLAAVQAELAWDEVYIHWTPHDDVYLVETGVVVPPWLPQVTTEVCDPSVPMLTSLPIDLFALVDLVQAQQGDGWSLVGLPTADADVGVAGLTILG